MYYQSYSRNKQDEYIGLMLTYFDKYIIHYNQLHVDLAIKNIGFNFLFLLLLYDIYHHFIFLFVLYI